MKCLFITATNMVYDGRTRELLSTMLKLTENKTTVVSTSDKDIANTASNHYIIRYTSIKDYFRFVLKTIKIGKEQKGVDVLFVDNRKASIPGVILNSLLKPKKLVYDARELYLLKETKHFVGKMGCFFEKMVIKKADIVIAANEERKNIMEDYYEKKGNIIVFENYRKLQFSPEYNHDELLKKYGYLFKDPYFVILSTAGCDLSRDTLELLESLKSLDFPYRLILVGCSEGNDKRVVEKYIEDENLHEVFLLPKLEQDDLQFLIEHSNLGIAQYHKQDSNNLYCASGKVYEFLYGGIPIATSDNPPLLRLTKGYGVGVSSEKIGEAIALVKKDYEYYSTKVKEFIMGNYLEKSHKLFLTELTKALEEKSNG